MIILFNFKKKNKKKNQNKIKRKHRENKYYNKSELINTFKSHHF